MLPLSIATLALALYFGLNAIADAIKHRAPSEITVNWNPKVDLYQRRDGDVP